MASYPKAAFRLELDGKDLTDRVRPRLISLSLSEKRGDEADQLDVVLNDGDGKLAMPKKGAVLSLQLGWQGEALIDKGHFKVDEIEHSGTPDHITLRARSADFTAALRIRRERTWKNKTLGQILAEIAGPAGLQLRIDPALKAKSVAVLAQSRESDLALLKRLGARYDAVATIKAGRLLFNPKGKGSTASGAALPTFEIVRRDGDGHSYRSADREGYTGVTANWHDVHGATRHKVTAGKDTNAKRIRKVFHSEAEAKAAADGEHSRLERQKHTLSFRLALGRPDLYPERKGRVKGIKNEIDAVTWLIAEARHELGDGGLVTSIELEQAT